MTLVPMWETIKVLTAVADQMDKNSLQTAVGLSSRYHRFVTGE